MRFPTLLRDLVLYALLVALSGTFLLVAVYAWLLFLLVSYALLGGAR